MMLLAPVLTPHGLLMLAQSLEAEGEALALEPERGLRLEKAFARGAGHGLVLLGADEVGTTLSPTLSYWRKLGARYMTALCALPGIGERSKPPKFFKILDLKGHKHPVSQQNPLTSRNPVKLSGKMKQNKTRK